MMKRLLCHHVFILLVASKKLIKTENSVGKTSQQVGGQGFCADANNSESTARRFEQVGCAAAQQACASDAPCVAYACTDTYNLSVLYTSTGCEVDCNQTAWLENPSLITNSMTTDSQPYWSSATCNVISTTTQAPTGVWGMSAQGQTCTDFCASEGYTCDNDEAIPMLKTLAGQNVTSLVGRRRSGSADWFGDTVLGDDGKDCGSVNGDGSRRRYQYGVMLDWNDECYNPSDSFTETDPCSGTGDGAPAYTWRSWRSLCWCHATTST